MTESEVWKDIVGYEGRYKVSDKGNVFSVERRDSRGNRCGGRILRPSYDQQGYSKVVLYMNGVRKHKRIHRLVAEAFLPNPYSYPEINHRDEVKANNHVENLEWCTREYNVNHGKRTEKVSQKLSKKVKAVNVQSGEVLIFSSVMEARNKGYSGSVSAACRGVYKNGTTGKLIGDGHLYRGHKWSYLREGESS